MDWTQSGWRWECEGGRYEIEGPGVYSKEYDAYWIPTSGKVLIVEGLEVDGERNYHTTLEQAMGACKAHYNERRAHPIVRLVGGVK